MRAAVFSDKAGQKELTENCSKDWCIKKLFLAFLLFAVFFVLAFGAAAVGVSPPRVFAGELNQGGSYEDFFTVLNAFDYDAEFYIEAESEWIGFFPDEARLRIGEALDVGFLLDVPSDAEPGYNKIRAYVLPKGNSDNYVAFIQGVAVDISFIVIKQEEQDGLSGGFYGGEGDEGNKITGLKTLNSENREIGGAFASFFVLAAGIAALLLNKAGRRKNPKGS